MSDTIDRMKRVFDEALALAERKNQDYGDAWRDQGWRGNLSRVFEKAKRLRTLLWNGNHVDPAVRENVRETAIDQINTLVFFIMNHDAGVEWGHEQPYPPSLDQGAIFPSDLQYEPGIASLVREGLAGDLPVREPGAAMTEEIEKKKPTPGPRGKSMPDRTVT